MPSVPASLSGLDHAAFDARFIQTWQPNYPWTKSTLPVDPEASEQDVIEWTKAQLAEVLRKDSRLRGYDFDRDAFTYAAFELARWSLQTVHLRQMNIDMLTERLRLDFTHCLEENQLTTADPRSPLMGQGIVTEQSKGVPVSRLPLTSRHDRGLLEVLAGGLPKTPMYSARPRIKEWLQKEPLHFLATLDRGAVRIQQETWRGKMWAQLDGVAGFAFGDEVALPAATRESMLNDSIDAMVDEMPTPIVSPEMEREISEEVFRRRRTAELLALDVGKLRALLCSRTGITLMQIPSKEDLVKQVLHAEIRQAGGTFPKVPVLELPVGDERPVDVFTAAALADCLEPLLGQSASPARDEKIRQRLIIPEYQILVSAQKMLDFLLTEESKRAVSSLEVEDISLEVASEMEQIAQSLRIAHRTLLRAYEAIGVNHAYRPIAVILDFIVNATGGSVNIRRQRSMI